MKLEQTLRSNHLQPCSARLLLWLLGLGVVAGQVRAQETFTWEQLRDKFKQTNPTLLSDAVNIDESRAEEITAYLRPNPNLALFADQFTVFKTPNTPYRPLSGVDEGGTISYLHERQHKRELRLESAQENTSIVASTHADLERNLLFTLRTAFVNALQAKAFFDLAKRSWCIGIKKSASAGNDSKRVT